MKLFIISILFIFPLGGFSQFADFTLKGKIGRLNAPATLYFDYVLAGKNHSESAVLQKGNFKFEGKIDAPIFVRLILDYDGQGMTEAARSGHQYWMYIEKGKNQVVSPDSLHHLTFVHSAINEESMAYNKYIGGSPQDISTLVGSKMAAASPEQQRNPAFKKKLDDEFHSLFNARKQKQIAYIQQNPDSYFSLSALSESQVNDQNILQADSLFHSLSAFLQNCSEGQSYNQRLAAIRNTTIGKTAPEFTQKDTANNAITLSQYQGKYLLLDFWASWCGPCRAENPNLVKAYASYKEKGLEILGVSLDSERTRKDWIAAIEKDGLTWPQVSDLNSWNNEAALLYGIRAVPQNYLIDPQGKIVAKNLRGEELQKTLEQIFGK